MRVIQSHLLLFLWAFVFSRQNRLVRNELMDWIPPGICFIIKSQELNISFYTIKYTATENKIDIWHMFIHQSKCSAICSLWYKRQRRIVGGKKKGGYFPTLRLNAMSYSNTHFRWALVGSLLLINRWMAAVIPHVPLTFIVHPSPNKPVDGINSTTLFSQILIKLHYICMSMNSRTLTKWVGSNVLSTLILSRDDTFSWMASETMNWTSHGDSLAMIYLPFFAMHRNSNTEHYLIH